MIGQELLHYRITATLGVGGMGEVYRATDTKLQREVAIKVLPPEVARDPERLLRFRREAQLLAALNHAGIAAIYGLEEADGQPFLALELVEGEDLKARLARGPIPVDEALEIAQQISEALEEAHNKGIVHRDLKPANVKLTPEGRVKVLDFGLAKAWAGEGPNGSLPGSSPVALTQSPTLAHTGTVAGVILGTAGYMSPEQARGRPVDRRADVWSFGVLLWEMLTGRALFTGETVTDVIAAVVTQEPDLEALPPATPRAVRRLIGRCLRKDPRQRLPDIGAARLELQDVRAGTTGEGAQVEGPPPEAAEAIRRERRRRVVERSAWAAAALALIGACAVLTWLRLAEVPEPRPAAHFVLETPEDLAFADFSPVAISPDGRHVVFVGLSSDGTTRLWMRPLDSPESRALPGTEGAGAPFWSPDSTAVAYFARGELRKLGLADGTVQRVCGLPRGDQAYAYGTWNRAGTIVFANGGDLFLVSAAGGEARPLTSHDGSKGETGHFTPQFLPDGRRLLFTVGSSDEKHTGLHLLSLDQPTVWRRVVPGSGRRTYVAPSHLLSARDGILTVRQLDLRSLAPTGEPVPIASSVGGWSAVPEWGLFSPSDTGRLAWVSGVPEGALQLEWLDRSGKRLGRLGEPGRYGQIALSPDGRRVAVELLDKEGRSDLWVIDVERGVASRLTTDPANETDPVWSPDSQALVFTSDTGGDQNLLLKGLLGSEPAAPLPGGIGQTPSERDIAECWTRPGNTLVYMTLGTERTLRSAPLGGGGAPATLVKGGFALDEPQVSPDGRWLAYISTESGRFEVYVEPFRRRGARVRVSTSGGGQPKWRGDGRELFFLSLDRALMAVGFRAGAAGPEVGMPSALIAANDLQAVIQGPDFDDYAVSADGQRFLVKARVGGRRRPQIHVLLDWPSLLPQAAR